MSPSVSRSLAAASRRSVAAVLGALLAGAVGCGAGTPGGPEAGGSVEPRALEDFLGNGLRYTDDRSFGLDISELIEDPDAPGGQLLRAFYPSGSAARSSGGPDGGLQAYLRLPEPTEVLELGYQVRFADRFEFVKGGKLPGLYGGNGNNGGRIPDGSDGFSTRYMWRADGAGEVYAYLPSSQEHGTSLGRGCWSFPPGEWTTIRQRVQLNGPGEQDGRISVWQDERLVLDRGGLTFRDTDELQIDGLFVSTFFGGGDSSWASPSDQHVDFADFTLTEGSAPPPGQPSASDDDSDCGTRGAP
jgi:hypothetical protein